MNRKTNGIATTIIILAVTFFSGHVNAQSAGFFLDDWQEKTAVIPDYEPASKPTSAATVKITLDINNVLRKVPQYIYGNNAVTWAGNMNEDPAVIKNIRNLNPHVIRWPGGNLSQVYFWDRASDSPPEDIPEVILPGDQNPWYGVNDDNWQQSTDDFYDLLANSNSTGSICVNYAYARYGTGPDPVASAAHLAAEWVRYDNGRTRFWEIGNENFGNWEAGYIIDTSLNQDGQPEYISGKLYGQHCRVFIDSMRKAATKTGADIKIGVVAYDAETSYDTIQTYWNEGMMPEVGDVADFLIVHSYFTPYDEDSPVSTILNSHPVAGHIMDDIVADMSEAGKPMIPVAFTEWNIFAVGSMQQVSYINGMHSALVLGEFINNSYGMACRWDLVNGWNNGNDHGMFSTGNEPGVDHYDPRPVFFYMYYFQKFFGDRMAETTVTGSDQVIAYGSTFSSGHPGMVIVNKSTTDETVRVETQNFELGEKYYYYTLTGGTDNGDFSRKVFINGQGTDKEGGGPENYEQIKAYTSETEGGIKVTLPALSVVYLMLDTEYAPMYVHAKIDTCDTLISIEFTDTLLLEEAPTGIEVKANGTTPLTVKNLMVDTLNPLILHVILDQPADPDYKLTVSLSGSDVMGLDSVPAIPFQDEPVENLLPGAAPLLQEIFTDTAGSTIRLTFNMDMEVADTSYQSFQLVAITDTARSVELSAIAVDPSDSGTILLTPAEPLYREYELLISYSGTSVMSADSGLPEPFDSLSVTNRSPYTPPFIVSAEVTDYGFSVLVTFDKVLNDLPGLDTLFTVKSNDQPLVVKSASLSGTDLEISLDDQVRYGDKVTLSYNGTRVTSANGGFLKPLENYPVTNNLPEPTVFDIPGMLDAEQFTIISGMTLAASTDTGGGNIVTEIDAGDWSEYEVDVARSAIYFADVRVASAGTNGIIYIEDHDDELIPLGEITTRATGGLNIWKTYTSEIPVYEGRHTIRLTAGSAYFNLNWLEFRYSKPLNGIVLSARTNVSGDVIEITFDREIDDPGTGEIPNFTVEVDDNPVAIDEIGVDYNDKSILWLGLAAPLTAEDQEITISCEPGLLVSLAHGIPVDTISGLQVINTTGIGSNPYRNIEVYPNPASERITIESDGTRIEAVEILDITGKLVLKKDYNTPGQVLTIDLDLPAGIYLLHIVSDNFTVKSTLIIN